MLDQLRGVLLIDVDTFGLEIGSARTSNVGALVPVQPQPPEVLHDLLDILPPGIGVTIDHGSWPLPPVFAWLQKLGDVEDDEMYRVFTHYKRDEWEKFMSTVTEWDLRQYWDYLP